MEWFMRVLYWHVDRIKFKPVRPATKNRDEPVEGDIENALVCFVSIEKEDEKDEVGIINGFMENLREIAKRIGVKKIVLYPYAHLSSNLASLSFARSLFNKLYEVCKREFECYKAPFGWYKEFEVKVKGHPLAESFRIIQPIKGKPEFFVFHEKLIEEEEVLDISRFPKGLGLLIRKVLRGEDLSLRLNLNFDFKNPGPRESLVIDLILDYMLDLFLSLGWNFVEVKGFSEEDLKKMKLSEKKIPLVILDRNLNSFYIISKDSVVEKVLSIFEGENVVLKVATGKKEWDLKGYKGILEYLENYNEKDVEVFFFGEDWIEDVLKVHEKELEYKGGDLTKVVFSKITLNFESFVKIAYDKEGKVPFWLSPVQVRIIPVSEKFLEKAEELLEDLSEEGFRVEIDDRDLRVSKKIRDAELEGVYFTLVIGEKEVESGKIPVREKGKKEIEEMGLEEFIEYLFDLQGVFPIRPLYWDEKLSKRVF